MINNIMKRMAIRCNKKQIRGANFIRQNIKLLKLFITFSPSEAIPITCSNIKPTFAIACFKATHKPLVSPLATFK